MFRPGDKVVTPAGNVSTVQEALYRVRNAIGLDYVVAESELKPYVAPEDAWQELAKKVAEWVSGIGVPLFDDEWARVGNYAVDYLQEQGITATDQDKTTINLLITASVAATPAHPF